MKNSLLCAAFLVSGCSSPQTHDAISSPTRHTMWHTDEDGATWIRFGDELFAGVHYQAEPKPYIYPLIAPGGTPMTRSWPQEEGDPEQEDRDHPHHTSFWFAHGNVNGVDFWHPQAKNGGTIEFTGELKETLSRVKRLRLRHSYAWKNKAEEILLTERRTHLFGAEKNQRWIDVQFELTAVQDEVRFVDTKEGTFALRLHPELRLRGKVAKGKGVNSEGVTGKEMWGKRSAWVHYQGTVAQKEVGVAIFEHPDNFRYPTWWHARDYGLVAANPFGIHNFERKEPGAGDHTLKKGETLELRYRVWLHSAGMSPKAVAAAYKAFLVQSEKL